jgi:hypothetical protein
VDGLGGMGKTFLYKALLARVRSRRLIAIATATSGIAASILPGGRTEHSRFKIPIKIGDNSMCSFTKQSGTTELHRRAALITWDEVAMTKRQYVKTLDRSLQISWNVLCQLEERSWYSVETSDRSFLW